MKMNKAVFFDRDGTVNIEKNYLYKIEDFEFMPRIIKLLEYYKQQDYLLILITNQSGIARGFYSEQDVEKLHMHMQTELAKNDVAFNGIYYCPHHPDGIVGRFKKKCKCRKPGPLLFQKAINDFHINPKDSIAIGDKERDLIPAREMGMRCILLSNRPSDYETYETIEELYRRMKETC